MYSSTVYTVLVQYTVYRFSSLKNRFQIIVLYSTENKIDSSENTFDSSEKAEVAKSDDAWRGGGGGGDLNAQPTSKHIEMQNRMNNDQLSE